MNSPMMTCGHTANATHHRKDGVDEPACVICSCYEVAHAPPVLEGRMARCAYFGKRTGRNNESNYGSGSTCTAERSSSPDLPFFEYLGPGSPAATLRCVCGLAEKPHRQPWSVVVQVDRNWFRRGRIDFKREATIYADTQEDAESEAEAVRVCFANWDGPDGGKEETRIFGARVESLRRISRWIECPRFVVAGPATYDKFYCGCHGWD